LPDSTPSSSSPPIRLAARRITAADQPATGELGASYAPGNPALLGQRLVVRKMKKRFDGLKRPTFRSASAP
jgi:hypothetical protein